MRNRTVIRVLFALLACASLLVGVSAAYAADSDVPSFGAGQRIKNLTFDTASPSENFDSIGWYTTPDLSSAYWGRTSAYKRGASGQGLWCAATLQGGGVNPTTTTYPPLTRGYADLSLSALSDYYSSKIQLYYLQPSLGPSDQSALRMVLATSPMVGQDWAGNATAHAYPENPLGITTASAWALWQQDLTNGTVLASRGPVYFRTQFYDDTEGGDPPAPNGVGATVDDVQVFAYRYGPVRNFTAVAASTTSVNLAWQVPQYSKTNSTDDARPMSFRVWYSPRGQHVWTEATSTGSRWAASPYTVTGLNPGTDYDFHVQAWDQGAGDGYGEMGPIAEATTQGTPAPGSVTGTIHAVGGGALSGVHVVMSGGAGTADTAADGTYSIANVPAGHYTVTFTKTGYNALNNLPVDVYAGAPAPLSPDMTAIGGTVNVWRFRYTATIGNYLWTADPAESQTIQNTLSSTWAFEGPAYSFNSGNPANKDTMWRFKNKYMWSYFYSADPAEVAAIQADPNSIWRYEGPTSIKVARNTSTPYPVWRFRCLKNPTYLWTADPSEKNTIDSTLKSDYQLEGIAYWLGK